MPTDLPPPIVFPDGISLEDITCPLYKPCPPPPPPSVCGSKGYELRLKQFGPDGYKPDAELYVRIECGERVVYQAGVPTIEPCARMHARNIDGQAASTDATMAWGGKDCIAVPEAGYSMMLGAGLAALLIVARIRRRGVAGVNLAGSKDGPQW